MKRFGGAKDNYTQPEVRHAAQRALTPGTTQFHDEAPSIRHGRGALVAIVLMGGILFLRFAMQARPMAIVPPLPR